MIFSKTQRLCCSLHSSFTWTPSAGFHSQCNRNLTPRGPTVPGPCVSHLGLLAPSHQAALLATENIKFLPHLSLCTSCAFCQNRETHSPKCLAEKNKLWNYLMRFHVRSRKWQIELQSNQDRVSLGKIEIHVNQPYSLNDGL